MTRVVLCGSFSRTIGPVTATGRIGTGHVETRIELHHWQSLAMQRGSGPVGGLGALAARVRADLARGLIKLIKERLFPGGSASTREHAHVAVAPVERSHGC